MVLTFGGFYDYLYGNECSRRYCGIDGRFGVRAVILYYAGRLIPKDVLKNLLEGKVGKRLHFETEDVHDAEGWFLTTRVKALFSSAAAYRLSEV